MPRKFLRNQKQEHVPRYGLPYWFQFGSGFKKNLLLKKKNFGPQKSFFCGSFLPSWIRIRIQPIKNIADLDPHHRIEYCEAFYVVTDLVEPSVEGAPGLPDAVLPYLVPRVGVGRGQVSLLLVRLLQVARVLCPELLVQRARDQTPAKKEIEVFVLIRSKYVVLDPDPSIIKQKKQEQLFFLFLFHFLSLKPSKIKTQKTLKKPFYEILSGFLHF